MMQTRRSFITGLFSAVAAPAVITTPGLLMPVKSIILPPLFTGADLGTCDSWTVVIRRYTEPLEWRVIDWHKAILSLADEMKPTE